MKRLTMWCLTFAGAAILAALTACASASRVDVSRLRVENGVTLRAGRPFTGIALETAPDGRHQATPYVDGRRDGADTAWHANGRVAAVRHYARGVERGAHRGWWPNGRPRFAFTYVDGRLEGEAREWFADGRLYREFHYAAGQEAGNQRAWLADGTLQASYVVRDGRRFGLMGAKGCVTRDTTDGADSRDATGLPYYADSTRTPRWDDGARAHRVADFALVDQAGRAVSARSLRGRVYVASFFYVSCRTLCPTVRAGLAAVRDSLRADSAVWIVSHTVSPETDDVPALAHYARLNGIGDGRGAGGGAGRWRLLTGARTEVERLASASYFVELADTTGYTAGGALTHTETLVLVDRDGRVRGMYEGSLPYEREQLVRDARALARNVPVSAATRALASGD